MPSISKTANTALWKSSHSRDELLSFVALARSLSHFPSWTRTFQNESRQDIDGTICQSTE